VFQLRDSAWLRLNDSRMTAANSRSAQNGTALSPGRSLQKSSEFLSKGSKVYVEGKLQTSSWEVRQSREKKYRTEIVAKDLVLLGSHEKGNGVQPPRSDRTEKSNSASAAGAGAAEELDDSVPF
jgi:single-strand DNA-binding protein